MVEGGRPDYNESTRAASLFERDDLEVLVAATIIGDSVAYGECLPLLLDRPGGTPLPRHEALNAGGQIPPCPSLTKLDKPGPDRLGCRRVDARTIEDHVRARNDLIPGLLGFLHRTDCADRSPLQGARCSLSGLELTSGLGGAARDFPFGALVRPRNEWVQTCGRPASGSRGALALARSRR
jgi:hypothetical protein